MPDFLKTKAIADKYSNNPLLRSLIQLFPYGIGSAIDTFIIVKFDRILAQKATIFFNELEKGNVHLSDELINSEDFLHCYFATRNAVINSRREEKIRLLARMLKNSFCNLSPINTDEFEEYLSILDDLSYRELVILQILYRYEEEYPMINEETPISRSSRFWDKFIEEVSERINVRIDELYAMLIRLNRSGCYETFIGNYYGYSGDKGRLTIVFYKLVARLVE